MVKNKDVTGGMFPWFLTVFVTVLIVSNVIAGRLVQVGPFVATSAMFLFAISYVVGDVIPEVWGYSVARKMVWFGAFANAIMMAMFVFTSSLPVPPFFGEEKAAYDLVLGLVPRTVVFSILGYLVGSFANAVIMARMKARMIKWDPNHKFLALRTIVSTLVGEGLDSLIFITGVFLFTMPLKDVATMILLQWSVKVLVEAIMTPITVKLSSWVKKKEGVDMVATADTSYTPFSLKTEPEKNLSNT